METSIPKVVKEQILKQNLTLWGNTIYDLSIKLEGIELVPNKQLEENYRKQLEDAIKMRKFYQKKLNELTPKRKK